MRAAAAARALLLRAPLTPSVRCAKVFESMDALGLPRDAITYSALISALSKGRQWSLGAQQLSQRLVLPHVDLRCCAAALLT